MQTEIVLPKPCFIIEFYPGLKTGAIKPGNKIEKEVRFITGKPFLYY
jgi:hypothetical protein